MKMIKTLSILCTFFLFCTALVAQNKDPYTVKGSVVDALGEEVIGASVFVKGTDKGTITDLDGKFSITVPANATHLVISYVGHKKQEVSISPSKTELSIILTDGQNLDELVVVGYGVQKKSNLTSSIETVKAEELLKMPVMNLDEALVGQVAGLHGRSASGDPSAARGTQLRIRGMSEPLLVLDGIPQNNSTTGKSIGLSDLNMDDIESVSILKDAAAAAVYGIRGANGIILVTTKRGVSGKKVKINYRGQYNLQEATKLPKFVNAYDFAVLHNLASINSGRKEQYSPEALDQIKNQTNRNKYANENLLDYLDKTGYNTSHSLTLSGGSEAVRYYISGGYAKNKGLYGGIGRDRYNYSLKLDANLSKNLTLSVDAIGSFSDYKNTRSSGIDAAYSSNPTEPLRFENGLLTSLEGRNPLLGIEGLGGYTKTKYNMNTVSARLDYRAPFLEGLSAYVKGSMDKNNNTAKTFSKPVTLYTYTPGIGGSEGVYAQDPNTTHPKAKISLTEINSFFDKNLIEAGLNYSKRFKKHEVTGLLVASYEESKNRSTRVVNPNLQGPYPEIIGSTASAEASGSEGIGEMASLIGRGTYAYDSRYFFETSFRLDGSTTLHPDVRWAFFPTVSVAWAISNEDFFKNWKQDILSNAKLRSSVGKLGDLGQFSAYQYLDNYMYTPNQGYEIGGILGSGVVSHSNYTLPNPYLEWGKSTDYNIATDLGFWDNRINVTFEHYWKYRTDYVTTAESHIYPPSTGAAGNLPLYNTGKVKVWGWDLSVNHKNAINHFKYDFTFVISGYKDKVLEWVDESSLPYSQRLVGRPFSTYLAYEADGLFQTQEEIDNHPVDQDGSGNSSLAPGDIKYKDQPTIDKDGNILAPDGILDKSDQIRVKSSSFPDMSYSFKLGLSYKGFFMNTMFQGVSGYSQRLDDIYTLEGNSLQRFQTYHRDETWREDRPNAEYPRIKFATSNDNNRKVSTFWTKKSNYLRLKMLSFGYTFPAAKAKSLGLSSLSISVQGNNLFTWTSLKDMDPESLRGYPIQRSYGILLNLGF